MSLGRLILRERDSLCFLPLGPEPRGCVAVGDGGVDLQRMLSLLMPLSLVRLSLLLLFPRTLCS